MKTIEQIVVENVLKRLKKAGIKQKEFARIANLNYQGVNRVLKGHSPPGRTTIIAFAKALGCTPEDLYKTDDEPISGREMIKAAVKEALAEGPLPQKFEHFPSDLSPDKQRLLDAITLIDDGLARQILKMIEPLIAHKMKDNGGSSR